MKFLNQMKTAFVLALGITICAPAFSQTGPGTSREYVEERIAETLNLIEEYYEEQLDVMIAEAQILLEDLDKAVAARQQEKRRKWAQMADDAQEQANAQLGEMQEALVRFAQQVGKFQAEADRGWKEFLAGVIVALRESADVLSATLEPLENED